MASFKRNEAKQLKFVAHFHGETMYRCPHCEDCSEYYDIIKTKFYDDRFRCPRCRKIVKFKFI